ncbi:methylosome subunit pICln-like [Amphiura filiformis]|uniref:methylosome subunit pICln-like n=1 Tax=Amphiura filiformis TaxID=82378 RepID=UPI003B219530
MCSTMGFLSSVSPPVDGIRLQENNVNIYVEREDFGKGTLYIAESQVTWMNASGQGCIIPYPAISLHAVSRDLSAFPHQCLYLMIDGKLMGEVQQVDRQGSEGQSGGQGDGEQTEGTEEEEEAFGAVREIRFVAEKNENLGSMFDAMTDCQVLHPDPEDDDSDDGEEYDDAEEEEEEEGNLPTDNNQGIVIVPSINGSSTTEPNKDEPMDTGQFDDADMEPDH